MAECPIPSIGTISPSACVKDPSATGISTWRAKDESSPFIDHRNCYYSIVVDKAYDNPLSVTDPVGMPGPPSVWPSSQYGSFGAFDVDDPAPPENRYFAYGIDKLIEFYHKGIDYAAAEGEGLRIRQELIERANTIFHAPDDFRGVPSYISPRPGAYMKVLVQVPIDAFEELGDINYDPDYSPERALTAEYDIRLIKTQIEFVAKIIKNHYGKRHGNPFGNTRNLDLKSEARKMEGFLSKLQSLLTDNKLDIDLDLVLNTRADRLRIVVDREDYSLLDIVYIQSGREPKYMRIGWPRVSSNTTTRTSGLIYFGPRLFPLFNSHINPAWKEFVETYIKPPPDMNMAFGSGIAALDDINDGIDRGIEIASEVLGWSTFTNEVLSGRHGVMPLIDNYIKTEADLLLENDNIFNEAFQSNLIDNTNRIYRHTDSSPFINWDETWSRIGGNLEGLYRHFLNHIDVRYLIAKVAACSGMDPTLIDPTLLDIIRKLIAFLDWLANMDWSTFDFDWNFIQLGFDMMEDLVNYVINYLVSLVNIAITEVVLWLLGLIDQWCVEGFDYGAIDITGLLSDNFSSPREAAAFYGSIAGNMGSGDGSSSLLKELIREISAVLLTSEICLLLRGGASQGVMTIVRNIIMLPKYEDFHDRFETNEDVKTFFASLGGLVNDSFCELGSYVQPVELCSDAFHEDLRRALMEEGSPLAGGDIQDQLDDERARRIDILNQLGEMVNSTDGGLAERISAVLDKGEIAEQIIGHPVAQESMGQMVQSLFVGPLTILANEGLGELETPYRTVEYVTTARALARQVFLPNRGIMHIVSDLDEYKSYVWGRTEGSPPFQKERPLRLESAAAADPTMVSLLSFINLNPNSCPQRRGAASYDRFRAEGPWPFQHDNYILRTSQRLGAYDFYSKVEYEIAYDGLIYMAHSWWQGSYPSIEGHILEMPMVTADFIQRTPLSGFGRNLSPPENILRDHVPNESVYVRLDSHVPSSDAPGASLQMVSAEDPFPIFNNLPKVFIDGLIPSYDSTEYIIGAMGSNQSSTYANFITKKVDNFLGTIGATPGHDSRRELVRVDTSEKLINTYGSVFNDVVRILYRFVTDSGFHPLSHWTPTGVNEHTAPILEKLRENFNNSDQLLSLLGVSEENMKGTIGDGLLGALQGEDNLTKSTFNILGESALRFYIRIYILEIFLKNIYMLTGLSENPNKKGREFWHRPGGAEEKVLEDIGYATSLLRGAHILDLSDIADPMMVSYIANYIKVSSSEERTDVDCRVFYDVASKLAETALQELQERRDSEEETPVRLPDLRSGPGSPASINYQDVLAYYPDPGGGSTTPEDALKYYIAKELQEPDTGFLAAFQNFIDLRSLTITTDNVTPRTLIECFLDKFQIVGHNISQTSSILEYNKWEDFGEGLYMEYYFRNSITGDRVSYVDVINPAEVGSGTGLLQPLDKFGLRVCIRDSIYHKPLEGSSDIRSFRLARTLEGPFDYIAAHEDTPHTREQSWKPEKGLPIVEFELSWRELKNSLSVVAVDGERDLAYQEPRNLWIILNHLKREIVNTDDFRVMFEYVFPVKKLFNLLFITMDQNMSAFLNNTKDRGTDELGGRPDDPDTEDDESRLGVKPMEGQDSSADNPSRFGVLNASSIDPEQFRRAKAYAKSILENVNNSDNYT